MTMRNRVILIFSILVVLTAVVSVIGINAVDETRRDMLELSGNVLERIRLAGVIQRNTSRVHSLLGDALHLMRIQDKVGLENASREIERLRTETNENVDKYEGISLRPEAVQKFRQALRDRRELADRILELGRRGELDAAVRLRLTEGDKEQAEVDEFSDDIVKTSVRRTADAVQLMLAASQRAYWLLILIAAFALIVGVVSGFVINRTITSTVSEVRNSIAEINTAAQQQVTSAQEQAAALGENTASLSEIRETSREASDRAKSVGDAGVQAAKNAQAGRNLAGDVTGKTQVMREKIERMAESILTLSDQVQRIGDIVVSVNEISEQTKILALNASIEAAKAGEEGKGFAVVATQIRDLANQAKDAGGRINAVITDIQKASRESVRDAQEGTKVVSEMTDAMNNLGASFQEIAATIEEVSQQVVQVATGARQQESGINQITAAMTQIDAGMKQSLASAQQTLKSIQQIAGQIKTLGAGGAGS